MKALLCGFSINNLPDPNLTFSTLSDSTPYGFDIVIVDPLANGNYLGSGQPNKTISRWQSSLAKWCGSQHRVIVILRPNINSGGFSNYAWLPSSDFNPGFITECGTSNYIGDIVATDAYIVNFLRDHQDDFSVVAHYVGTEANEHLKPSSIIHDHVVSSFSWKDGTTEVIFLPTIPTNNLLQLISKLDASSTKWKIGAVEEIEQKIQEDDSKIEDLRQSRATLSAQLQGVNSKVNNIVTSDIYLKRAIRSYELTQSVENPNPENFYESLEAIEKAFSSERAMRESLGLSKNFIDSIMRRANEFRHVAGDGAAPTPLSEEEKVEFSVKTESVIKAYLNFLYIQTV
jgi:hypothetical protein